jgi:hypothetical protein
MSIPQEALTQHPYVVGENSLETPRSLVRNFPLVVNFGIRLLNSHADKPIDVIVGDDVSGRIPALISRRLFTLAHTDDRVETIPKTYFMASGNIRTHGSDRMLDKIDKSWRTNLRDHAEKIIGETAAKKVVVLTELISSGVSVQRLEDAFSQNGVEDVSHIMGGGAYLHGINSDNKDRRVVGVEKHPPAPTTRRHSWFNGSDSAQLRYFLDDYTSAIYQSIKDQEDDINDIDDIETRGGY